MGHADIVASWLQSHYIAFLFAFMHHTHFGISGVKTPKSPLDLALIHFVSFLVNFGCFQSKE
jgi:hypothetical protein